MTRDWAGLLLSKRTSKKGSLWLTSISMVNLMLYWKNSNASFLLLNRQNVNCRTIVLLDPNFFMVKEFYGVSSLFCKLYGEETPFLIPCFP